MSTFKQSRESASGGAFRNMAIGAGVLLTGLMLVDVLPNMLKSFYSGISQQLVFGYGVFAFSAMGILLIFVMIGVIRDLPAFYETTAAFGWRIREAYLSGRAGKERDRKAEKKQ